jgi:parvulin-like peptidyl-prolyl isomerase
MKGLIRWFRVWCDAVRRALVRGAYWILGVRQIVVAAFRVKTEEARSYFNAHPRMFDLSEQVKLRLLIVEVPETASPEEAAGAEARAAEAGRRAARGEDFGGLVREYESNPYSRAIGGRIPFWISRAGLAGDVGEVERAVFSLRPGETTGPHRNPFGWCVMKVEARREAQQRTFRETRLIVKWYLRYLEPMNPTTPGTRLMEGA